MKKKKQKVITVPLKNIDRFTLAIAMLLTLFGMFINMFTNVMHQMMLERGGMTYEIYEWVALFGFLGALIVLWIMFKKIVSED